MEYVLQACQLAKKMGGKTLVSDVSLKIRKGEIYGFLGLNGAGKTTVMKMIANLWKPSKGSIELFGKPITSSSYDFLKRMGSIIEFPVFFDHMTGKENLRLHCEYMGYYNSDAVERALKELKLSATGDKPVREYSLGMRQRLGIARAVLSRPEFLMLDEPVNGLDPEGRKLVRELLKRLSREYGITVMISSHILSEIEPVADTVGIIHKGIMKKEFSMEELKSQGRAYLEITVSDIPKAAYALTEYLDGADFKVMDDNRIRIYGREISAYELAKVLEAGNTRLQTMERKSESLEEYFLKLTGEEGEDV